MQDFSLTTFNNPLVKLITPHFNIQVVNQKVPVAKVSLDWDWTKANVILTPGVSLSSSLIFKLIVEQRRPFHERNLAG